MDFQFYPTPESLGKRAWAKFKNRNFVRVLEPSAGTGDLIKAAPFNSGLGVRRVSVDVCEIDVEHHPKLRSLNAQIIGHDFMQIASGAIYAHCIMNPPFNAGAAHVLKAWDLMWDGEIVAILNAETIRNPYSSDRMLLSRLIEQYGSVEYIPDAFTGPGVKREAEVEVALVHLKKKADYQKDIIGDVLASMQADRESGDGIAAEYTQDQLPAQRNQTVENAVLVFNAAVSAIRAATFAEARARYYTVLLGKPMSVINSPREAREESGSFDWVRQTLAERYKDLKDRAWANVLNSTSVKERLSSAAKARLDKEFDNIKQMEFSCSNVYGFLLGLVEKQSEIQVGMACDVFDAITRYHSDNVVFYKGWKSNDAHRTCGRRIRTTRFILPNNPSTYNGQLDYKGLESLADFDKVFAMLDGRTEPELGLVDAFHKFLPQLRAGERISTSYFDIRWFMGTGTIHFFARDAAVVDRLNRLVGQHRKWLPSSDIQADPFWHQYGMAEKLDKEFRREIDRISTKTVTGVGPLQQIARDDEEGDAAREIALRASSNVLQRHGIDPDLAVADEGSGTKLLQLAA